MIHDASFVKTSGIGLSLQQPPRPLHQDTSRSLITTALTHNTHTHTFTQTNTHTNT